MPSTQYGFPYPSAGSHTRMWEHFELLAEKCDERFQQLNFKPNAKYRATVLQPITDSLDTKIQLPTAIQTHPLVQVTGNTDFRVLRGGTWFLDGTVRMDTGTGSGEMFVWPALSSDPFSRYTNTSQWTTNVASTSFGTMARLPVNTDVSMWMWQKGAGGVRNTSPGLINSVMFSLTWIGD